MAKTVLIKPVITEKATILADKRNTYCFIVNQDCNKIEIGNAVAKMYNVTVTGVNTCRMPGKPKSRNTKTTVVRGRKAPYKKAFVTLTAGERIEIFGAANTEED